jgi:hypothetical protein
MRGSWRTLAVAAVMMASLSCTRLETVSSPEVNAQGLVGHQIRVTTTDGRILEFELSMVTDDALVGGSERVRFDEIAVVERRDVSVWRTAAVAAGVVAVSAAVAFVVFLVQWLGALSKT